MGKTAVFNPAYCLTLDKSRLTKMSEQAVHFAVKLFDRSRAHLIIISTAYDDAWKKERDLKIDLLRQLGLLANIEVIENVTDSYDEARKIIEILKLHDVDNLIVAGEQEQIPRATRAIGNERKKAGLNFLIISNTFRAAVLERTYEPHPIKLLGWIKSVRAGNRLLWKLWNTLFGLIS